MKRRITVQLPLQLVERLEAAAERPGASKATIVEAALEAFLRLDTSAEAPLTRCLNGMSLALERLERDLKIVNETVALHVRYHLTVTPPLPHAEHRAACALGLERFGAFAAQVDRRLHLGTPLMRETMDRLSVGNPNRFVSDIDESIPLGTAVLDPGPASFASALPDQQPELSAAAREGGSDACFPGEDDRQTT